MATNVSLPKPLLPTDVYTIPITIPITITTINPMLGATEPVFTAVSSSPAVGATIGADANGAPVLVVNALTEPDANTATGITVEVSDSAGDVAVILEVPYPVPVVPGDIMLDLAAAVVTEQAAPTPAGP